MRILIACDTYYPHVNGASYFTQRLAHYLQKDGHDIAVIAPSTQLIKTKGIVQDILVYGVGSFPVPFYKGFRFTLFPFVIRSEVRRVIEEFKPDVIHIQSHFFIARTALAIGNEKHIPVVATNHFMPENLVHYFHLPTFIDHMIVKEAWRGFVKVFNKADHLTAPTKSAADLVRGDLSKPMEAVSCGIDLSLFKTENNGGYLMDRYHIPKDKLILFYVGRLDKEKNVDQAIRAMKEALKEVDFHFVIGSSGAEKKNLEALSHELGLDSHITFTGFIPNEDLPHMYTIADAFISGGIAELQCIVAMEAMASGLPVIAVNAVALPELVEDGYNGFLYENGNIMELADKMKRLFRDENLRKEMGQHSLEKIAKHDIHKTIGRFEEIYENLIAAK